MNNRTTLIVCYVVLILSFLILESCSGPAQLARAESVQKTSAAADELLLATGDLRKEINQKLETNPNSSSEDLVVLVDKKTKEIEQVQAEVRSLAPKAPIELNQKKKFDKIRVHQQRLASISREIKAIHKSFEKELDKKLRSDVYFETGSTNVNAAGYMELKKVIFTDINSIISEWKKEEAFTNYPLKLKVKVVGYADLQGTSKLEVRQKNNLQISQKRADAVEKIIAEYMTEYQKENSAQIQIEMESIGHGENPPPGLADLEMVNNPERRACFISCYVIPIF